nr:hypothetical protein [Tanacetum cinerariifolium]
FAGAVQALGIAHIADEEADGRVLAMRKLLAHLVLFQLIAREYDNPPHLRILLEYGANKLLAEGAGAARDEQRLAVEVEGH